MFGLVTPGPKLAFWGTVKRVRQEGPLCTNMDSSPLGAGKLSQAVSPRCHYRGQRLHLSYTVKPCLKNKKIQTKSWTTYFFTTQSECLLQKCLQEGPKLHTANDLCPNSPEHCNPSRKVVSCFTALHQTRVGATFYIHHILQGWRQTRSQWCHFLTSIFTFHNLWWCQWHARMKRIQLLPQTYKKILSGNHISWTY